MWTYSARLIAERLDLLRIPYLASSTAAGGFSLYDHGMCVEIRPGTGQKHKNEAPGRGPVYMSVQTVAQVAGDAFAETSLQSDVARLWSKKLGYGRLHLCVRHKDPEALFKHIEDTVAALADDDHEAWAELFRSASSGSDGSDTSDGSDDIPVLA